MFVFGIGAACSGIGFLVEGNNDPVFLVLSTQVRLRVSSSMPLFTRHVSMNFYYTRQLQMDYKGTLIHVQADTPASSNFALVDVSVVDVGPSTVTVGWWTVSN